MAPLRTQLPAILGLFASVVIDCPAGIIRVPADHPSIQAAITAAGPGDEVVISPGEYFETIDFSSKAIVVRGSDPDDPAVIAATIINGAGALHVVKCMSGEGPDTILRGLTITGGNANDLDVFLGRYGGGMLNAGSDPTVQDCIFRDNVGIAGGAIHNDYCNPRIERCTFIDNDTLYAVSSGAGISNTQSSPVILDCRFLDNTAGSGAAIANRLYSTPLIVHCTFTGGAAASYNGGGILNTDTSAPTIVGCLFAGNSAAASGGAICNTGSSTPNIINCTIVGNTAATGGGIRDLSTAASQVHNSILSGNVGGQVAGTAGTVIHDSLVQGGWAGTGSNVINAVPFFVDAGNGDCRLMADSPGIDAGADAALPADVLDLDDDGNTTELMPLDLAGQPRFIHAAVDLGAYESVDCAADLDGGGFVNVSDLLGCLAAWGGCPAPCPADGNGDSEVDVIDLLAILAGWGTCPMPCRPDMTGDGVVNVADLLGMLAAWGACPPQCPADTNLDGSVDVIDLLALLGAWGPCS